MGANRKSSRRDNRNRWTWALWVAVVAGIMLIAAHFWHSGQMSRKTARLSTLLVLRSQLLAYGEEYGVYPNRFEDMLTNPTFRDLVDPDTLESHAHWAQPLSAADERNLERLKHHPALSDMTALIDHMLTRGIKLEQEAVVLGPPTAGDSGESVSGGRWGF